MVADDINSPPVMGRSSHVYECLPLSNVGHLFSLGITWSILHAQQSIWSWAEQKPEGSSRAAGEVVRRVFVEVQTGVRRQPEMICDLAVHNCGRARPYSGEDRFRGW